MTITWKVEELDRELADGYVYQVHYSVNGDDCTYTSRAVGSIPLEKPETLIPYKDLTESTVIEWIKARIDEIAADPQRPGFTVAQIETALDQQIAEQATPTYGTGTPWAGEANFGPPSS